jgi:hypothetical protein
LILCLALPIAQFLMSGRMLRGHVLYLVEHDLDLHESLPLCVILVVGPGLRKSPRGSCDGEV